MKFSLARVSPEYSRFRRLVMGLLAVACLSIAAVSWETYSSFRERENATRAQAETYVQTIVVHVSDSIQIVDSALIGFANAIKALPAQKRNSAAAIGQLLAYHDSAASDDFRAIFIDANGIGVVATKNVAVQGTSYADRGYFKAHLGKQADQGLYVGEPMIGKITKKRIFLVSRRVESAQGEFLGVIAAPVDAARFASMFALARLNKDISITLLHRGGKIIARVPLFEQSFAASLLHPDLFEKTQEAPIQSFQANSSVGDHTMIYSSRALENMPLDVIVGISVQPLGQALQKDLLIGGAGILLMMTIMLLSTQVALRSYRRLELSKQALEESETRWKFALEGTGEGEGEGVWDWNVMSNEVHFSIRWSQMLGYAEDEIENNFDAWISRVHPDDKSRVIAKLQACLEGKTPVYLSEYRMQSKDGSWKWNLARGMVVSRDATGRAHRMIGTQADITDRKQTEQAQVHKIIEAAPDPMLLIGNDGIIAFANGAAQAAFGYAFNELKGQNVDDLVPFSSRSSHAHYRKKFETSKTQHPSNLNRPLTAMHKDGTEFPVEISLSSFQLDGQSVVIASIRDITERKCAAELLQQSFTQLRRLSDHQENIKENERKRIAQDIHDDLGQNLLALKMDVDTLYARTGGTHPKLNKRVSVVLNNINATIKSVKSIMNDLRPAALELGLYPAVEWQLKQFERRTRIACKLVTVAHEAALGLDADQTLAVFRILQESLANVVRHANATEVEIALSQDERGFLMQVKDNGKGLQPGDRRKANSFGLMGIKERIHALGGELIIASSLGNGTALSISIPMRSPHRFNNMQHLF
ncbi:MAG: PAS domain S-box protein [Glaciimonas sp.]|nr:PAS domain S-box protein [Glaciimonas sp.]